MANAKLIARGWGTYRVNVEAIHHGFSIYSSEAKSRVRKTMYTTKRSSDSFIIDVVFSSWQTLRDFLEWQYGYFQSLSDPHNQNVSFTDFLYPSRRFYRQCVPSGGLVFSDKLEKITYPLSLDYKGLSDPNTEEVSNFTSAPHDPTSRWFYPSTTPLDGSPAFERETESTSLSFGETVSPERRRVQYPGGPSV